MSKLQEIEQEARRMHTHTVVFVDRDSIECATRAMCGQTTKAIAREIGITESAVQYRIAKAQRVFGKESSFRKEFRNGTSPTARIVVRMLTKHKIVKRTLRTIRKAYMPLGESRTE